MAETPQVQEKAPKPPGLLPKHVQAWLLVGIAFLMVAIMWLTGGKKPATPSKTVPTPAAAAPLEVNETKITELQNRIEELQRQQMVAESALAQQTKLLAPPSSDGVAPPSEGSAATSSDPHTEDPIAAERKRRAYLGLFESNVALTYRPVPKDPAARSDLQAENPDVSKMLHDMELPVPAADAAEPSNKGSERKEETKSPVENHATAKTYLLEEGTILEAVLINRLDGQFSGPIECLVSTDVYSHDRQHLLIPAGSKLLGETKKVDIFGQTRLAVLFHRLIMPDGYSVSLDHFEGLNQVGDAGLRDQVNNHYLRIFGVSLAIGALGAVSEAGTAGALNASGSDLMRQGFAESTAQSSAQILDKFLNILPTITIREGHRLKVYLSSDLPLPDYMNHIMPPNF